MGETSSTDAIEAERTFPSRSLDFYFDYTCPFAYLGSTQAPAVAKRMGVPLTYRPILLGGVLKAVNTPQNLFATRGPARSAHEANDMARWARRFGVELRMPATHPMRSVEALRATLVTGIDPAVIEGFYRAYWVENRPISTPEVIREVVGKAGHDPDAVLAKIERDDVKEDLRRRTDEGIALGMFGAPVWLVDGKHFYWGQDRIHFVEGVRRPRESRGTRPRPERPLPKTPRTLEVYWDFSSPFAYFGVSQVEGLAKRTGAKVIWHPILLGGLFRAIGTPDVPIATFSEAKQRYTMKDLHRWSEYWRVPFRFPTRFPTNSLKALRVYLALEGEERRARFREATFRAYWAEDRDITDDAVLAECIGDETVARDAFARANGDEVKAALRTSTEEAAARGVFGVPTFVVGDDLFWGQDRLELVEDALLA